MAIPLSALAKIVDKSLLKVFKEVNLSSDAWFKRTQLLTIGRRNYARYIADSLGEFPLFGTTRSAAVEQAYIAVGITGDLERERYRDIKEISMALVRQLRGATMRAVKALTPLQAIEASSSHFALLGTAGSGKTTAFRHIAMEIAKGTPIRGKRRIPVYFAVRDMASEGLGILEAATKFLAKMEIHGGKRVLLRMLNLGNVVLLLDGLDETDKEHQMRLLRDLNDLRSRFPETLICLSGRPLSLAVGLAGFTKWETLPLGLDDRLAFVAKWFEVVNPLKGAKLLSQSQNRPELLDLGSSPLLLSIVCALYDNDLNIPSDPDELYGRAVEGLLGLWDAFRTIARTTVLSILSVRRRVQLVSRLAASLFEDGKIVFSVRDLEQLNCLDEAFRAMRCSAIAPDALLQCLSNDFGILVERAPGLYSFSHLTLHEYLTALFIVDNRKETSFLAQHRRDLAYLEVFRLVAKMLPKASEFMTSLTINSRLELPKSFETFDLKGEVTLLHATWKARPLVPKGIVEQLMHQLAGRIAKLSRHLAADFKVEGDTLFCKVEHHQEWLALLFDILNDSGLSYRELGFFRGPGPVKRVVMVDVRSQEDLYRDYDLETRQRRLRQRADELIVAIDNAEGRIRTIESATGGRDEGHAKLLQEKNDLNQAVKELTNSWEEVERQLATFKV